MKIYFARHGDYENPNQVVPYQMAGFPLSELGKSQINHTAEILKDIKFRAIFTSPITRCHESARIIGNSLHLFPNPKDSIIETRTPLQGTLKTDLPSDIYVDSRHIEGGGESKVDIITRMTDFVDKLKQTSKHSNYLIVSHGDPIMFYLQSILNKEIRYIPMGGLVMLDFTQPGIPKYSEII